MLREVGHRVRFVGHAEHADILIWSPNTTKAKFRQVLHLDVIPAVRAGPHLCECDHGYPCADNQSMSYRLHGLAAAALVLLAPVSIPAQEPMTTLPCVPDCRGVDLANATLTGLNLNGVDLVNANLSDATLSGVSLVGADLTGATLFCASLIDTDLTAATLIRADMRKVDLSGKEVGQPPVLIRAVLIGADLSDANLNGADLRGADLSYTTMTRTYLGSAILNGATMVDIQGCDDSRRLPGCYVNQPE